jgi:2-(1,2-epoxy-1,2-dihydrophenyl)acetyl-CoA isomerase
MTSVGEGPVLVDAPAPHVVRVLIHRPEKRNAIDAEVRQALLAQLPPIVANPDTRALVLGGAGGIFSAGGDVSTMSNLSEADARARMDLVRQVCLLVGGIPFPVVAAVEGFAVGGGVGLALLADHLVVGESTKIILPFFKLGIAPDWGLLHTLPLRVGLPMARRLFTEGKTTSGRDALALGLADQLAEGDVMAAAIERAVALAALPRDAFARAKARWSNPASSLADALAREVDDQSVLLSGPDFAEGFAAFTGKRAPDFTRTR